MQTLEGRFAGERAGTKDGSTVWIQYEGSREAEPLARNAAHCLPFEVLDAKQRDKTVFRLEYWVTKDKMWTVLEALVASIREGIVSRSDGYRAFSSDEEIHIDPSALLPTRVPLFSLVPQERLGVAHDDERNGIRKEAAQKGQEESRSNFFHIHPNTMESLAHAVSTAGTELLESDRRISGKNYRQSYQDATTAVAEAVCELLDDAGIRAAIQRRAKAKIAALSERREMDNTLNRQEKERFLIETAEAEAERVVRRILHEIRVDEARGA
nr:unknown [Trypanosoma cruzi]